jgi:Fe-S cluster assembly protein SufD
VFYLRSRGIGREEARRVLTLAFAGEILDRIPIEPLREELRQRVAERLAAMDPTGGAA